MTYKKLHLVLVGSLMVNALSLGYVVGTATPHFGPKHCPDGPPMMAREMKSLPPQLREKFDHAMKAAFASTKDVRDKIDQTRKEMNDLVSADTFDEKAYDAKSEQMSALMNEMGKSIASGIKAVALKATPEERKELAKMLQRGPFGAPPPHDRRGGNDRPGPGDKHKQPAFDHKGPPRDQVESDHDDDMPENPD